MNWIRKDLNKAQGKIMKIDIEMMEQIDWEAMEEYVKEETK